MALLSKLYINSYWKKRYGKLKHFILAMEYHCNANHEPVIFVQIGANEKIGYPMEEFFERKNWRSILVEPEISTFEKLVQNYSSHVNLYFENVAISEKEETKEFFFVKEKGNAPDWATQLNSLNKASLDWLQKEYPSVVIGTKLLECKPISFILKKHNLPPSAVSIVQIDTEGHDYVILKSFDLKQLKPKIIIFEHRHLSEDDYMNSLRFLKSHGYNIFRDLHDTLAFNDAVAETLFHMRYEL